MDKRCGECRFFRAGETRGSSTYGTCRLGKVMGTFSDGLRACPSFSRKGEEVKVVDSTRRTPRARTSSGRSGPGYRVPRTSASALATAVQAMESDDLKAALLAMTAQAASFDSLSIGQGWTDGVLALAPANSDLQHKEIPLEQLFNKLVMIREQLRVMEQKLNGCDALHRAERLDLQRRLDRVRRAVLAVGNGWLTPPSASPLLDQLWREAQVQSLSLPFPDLGAKWIGGLAILRRDGEQITEPVEHFFLRVVVLRDHLSVLEAELEARPNVPQKEAAAMCAHLRRCHGSLTTFNALFAQRSDYFSSSR